MERYRDQVGQWLEPELPDIALAQDDPITLDMLMSAASVHSEEGVFDPQAHPLDIVGTIGELARLGEQNINDALSFGETEGLYRLPLAVKHGKRRSTRELLLETVEAGHPLTIWTGAFVTRLLFDEENPLRVIGVEYVKDGAPYQASLRLSPATKGPAEVYMSREVILAAGAFNSPQLLMPFWNRRSRSTKEGRDRTACFPAGGRTQPSGSLRDRGRRGCRAGPSYCRRLHAWR